MYGFVRKESNLKIEDALMENGFNAATRMNVLGKGKQKGLKVGDIYYDEIPKELIMIVVEDNEEEKVINIISETSITGKEGTYGEGKIFILPADNAVRVRTGQTGNEALL